MTYNLFLDDERFPTDETDVIARSFYEAKAIVEERGLPAAIRFDHDLGETLSGYDFAQYLAGYCMLNNIAPNFEFTVHSQNPIGKRNIEVFLTNFKQSWNYSETSK